MVVALVWEEKEQYGTSWVDISEQFEYDYFGAKLLYSYTNCKIADYADEELERSDKLF